MKPIDNNCYNYYKFMKLLLLLLRLLTISTELKLFYLMSGYWLIVYLPITYVKLYIFLDVLLDAV